MVATALTLSVVIRSTAYSCSSTTSGRLHQLLRLELLTSLLSLYAVKISFLYPLPLPLPLTPTCNRMTMTTTSLPLPRFSGNVNRA